MNNFDKALAFLNKASILEVNGYLIHSWEINDPKDLEKEDEILAFSYTEPESSYIYEFNFSLQKFQDTVIVNENIITVVDTQGQVVDIKCFKLSPISILDINL